MAAFCLILVQLASTAFFMRFPILQRRRGSLAVGAVLCLVLVLPAQQPTTPADPGQQPPASQQPPAQQPAQQAATPADTGQQPPAAQQPPAQPALCSRVHPPAPRAIPNPPLRPSLKRRCASSLRAKPSISAAVGSTTNSTSTVRQVRRQFAQSLLYPQPCPYHPRPPRQASSRARRHPLRPPLPRFRTL